METKKCSKCGEHKPLGEFNIYTERRRLGKLRAQCKKCQYAQQYLTQKKYPEKMRCRTKARIAKAKGLLVSPEKCDKCGEKKKLAMHHKDYSKPYNVRWICVECHRDVHRKTISSPSSEESGQMFTGSF